MTKTETLAAPSAAVPEGYMRDHQGALWAEDTVKPLDKLRTELVDGLVARAQALRTTMVDFKATVMAEIGAFVDLAAAEYETSLGGVKGNLTLRSFDGLREVRVQVAENLAFDERLKVAEKLVGDCVTDWARDARPELQTLVQRAFKTDKEGNVSTAAVLALRRLNIEDERWQRAMRAIADSVVATGSKSYVRFYTRDSADGAETAISLNLAKL